MKINEVKRLAEEHSLENLNQMIKEIEEGLPFEQPVAGDDEGEKLTHLLGAVWIKEQMQLNSTDVKTELRNFAARVRVSIQ
ncbi:MAG: hypothetical protein NTX03_04515 [Bacteroidetes bacterium]|nr:hypothetical protein [Bacteroidota bacterium]